MAATPSQPHPPWSSQNGLLPKHCSDQHCPEHSTVLRTRPTPGLPQAHAGWTAGGPVGLSESPQFGDSAKEGRPLHAEEGAHQGVILPSAKGKGPARRPEGQG